MASITWKQNRLFSFLPFAHASSPHPMSVLTVAFGFCVSQSQIALTLLLFLESF